MFKVSRDMLGTGVVSDYSSLNGLNNLYKRIREMSVKHILYLHAQSKHIFPQSNSQSWMFMFHLIKKISPVNLTQL